MQRFIRTSTLLAGAIVLGAAGFHAAADPMTIVITGGPNAGSYDNTGKPTVCISVKAANIVQASFKDAAPKGKTPSEGSIKVDNPDQPSNTGELHVAFGTSKPLVEYNVDNVPITMTTKGTVITLTGSGKTKAGVALKITATCNSIERM